MKAAHANPTMNTGVDETHDPARTSWVAEANGHSDFPVQNLPFGIFRPNASDPPRAGVAIGESILDLRAVAALGVLPEECVEPLSGGTLNALFAQPAQLRRALRSRLFALLCDPTQQATIGHLLHRSTDCTLELPAAIGDYTDFYAGIHHAENVGRLFRPDNPLLSNYKHVPIAYHGRASSIRPSGTPVIRPSGQRKAPEADAPQFGPSTRLDYELELGIWIGGGNALGVPIPIAGASDHVAGLCLLNDWSARDIQAWEYQPLGPFLAKNFLSTVSPWVVTAEALAPFRIAQPPRPAGDPQPLAYLLDARDQQTGALAIQLEVLLSTAAMRQAGMPPYRLSQCSASNMYWTIAQLVTHHTSNGCNLNPGDLLGSGTISAPVETGYGSLLEITRGGRQPVRLPTGELRDFLEDGDEVTLRAVAHAPGRISIGFGPCRGLVSSPPHKPFSG